MKQLFYFIVLTLSAPIMGQGDFEEIVLSNGSTFLLGKITPDNLESASYGMWYKTNYENYKVDRDLIRLYSNALNQHEILLFLGTWCGDSKREVPRILKILDASNFPREQLNLVALDRRKENYKKSPQGYEKGWDIKRVPTLILLKDGEEVNRIVERPIDTLEEDLVAILSNLEYTPNYAN